jgi:hypothetical protein
MPTASRGHMGSTTIHTIQARDNVMLEVTRGYLGLTSQQMLIEIQRIAANLEELLRGAGVSYAKLRAALTPTVDREEVCLLFDWQEAGGGFYGAKIGDHVLELLNGKRSHSVLEGDLIISNPTRLKEAIASTIVPSRSSPLADPGHIFGVYVNNLTERMVNDLHFGLSSYAAYIGHIRCTYASWLKTYLSVTLMNRYVLHERKIILGHEDDLEGVGNYNVIGYPFEDRGFRVVSVPGYLFGLLLSYKIERPVLPGAEADTELSLNAITSDVRDIRRFEVLVEEAKVAYLRREKAGSLSRGGLEGVSASELATIIRARVEKNYFYNLSYNAEHDTAKFNVMIEVPAASAGQRHRLMVSLEYKPTVGTLRLVTMYQMRAVVGLSATILAHEERYVLSPTPASSSHS